MDIQTLTITKTRQALNKKDFSCVELINACFERIEKFSNLNSFITLCKKDALWQAKKADEDLQNNDSRPLLGIPIALKDLFTTKNLKTTAASKLLKDYVPVFDATVVKRLKDAGAIIVGKTNSDAWAHGSSGENSDFGPTRNPWNPEYVPGGSSSGSAAAVCLSTCLASSGTDTGGSIRLPASFNNIVGLKPTYGRVSRYGIIAMASSLDSIGHFTKTVEDCALYLSVTAGRDPFDSTCSSLPVPNFTKDLKKGIKGLKIGVPKEYQQGIDKNVNEKVKNMLNLVEKQGGKIVEISLPNTKYAIPCYYVIQPSEVSSNLARYDGIRFGENRSEFSSEAKRRIILGTYTLSSGYFDQYYKKAMKVRTLIKNDFDKAFDSVDAIITPVSPTPPWKIGEKVSDPLKMYLSDIFTVTANLAGIPGLAIPAGFVNNLPTGIQILGPQFSEELLFRIGFCLEQETLFYKNVPLLN